MKPSYPVIRIIGVDPGFDRLGVCVIDKKGNKETLVFSTCITTSKKESFDKRLSLIGESFKNIISEYKPNELAIETIFITKNQKTVIQVAEVRGVCIYISHNYGVSIHEYSPPQIKVAITGYGKATKIDIAHMIPKIVKMGSSKNLLDDEFDAIAIALTHSAHRKMSLWV